MKNIKGIKILLIYCIIPLKKLPKPIVGWREWVALPELGIERIKAKVDTGARTSSLHAFNIEVFQQDDGDYVRFLVHPDQKNSKSSIECIHKVLELRHVKSSNGKSELRPVIMTDLQFMNMTWPIEITLTNRHLMGFRMLLGRQSFRKKFLVDPGKSFLGGKLKN